MDKSIMKRNLPKRSHMSLIASLFNLVLLLCLLLWQLSPPIFSDNEPSTTTPPVYCRTGYTENTLTSALHGGITSTGTMLVDYFDMTWPCDEEENYVDDPHQVTYTRQESFSHSKDSSFTVGAAYSVGSSSWGALGLSASKVISQGWQHSVGTQVQTTSSYSINIPPGKRLRIEWTIDYTEGSYHRHQYELWGCYTKDPVLVGDEIVCQGEWEYEDGYWNVRTSDTNGRSENNLHHDGGTWWTLDCD